MALGLADHDWSAFYRPFNESRIDYEALTACFLSKTVADITEAAPFVAVCRACRSPRHSHEMPGTSWLKHPKNQPFMPGPHLAQRFLYLAVLLTQSGGGYSRALPLRWEPAFLEKVVLPEGTEPKTQWEAALHALRWPGARLDEAGRASQRLLILGDGDFSVVKMRALLPEGVMLMTRFARNRVLRELPGAEGARGGAGRASTVSRRGGRSSGSGSVRAGTGHGCGCEAGRFLRATASGDRSCWRGHPTGRSSCWWQA